MITWQNNSLLTREEWLVNRFKTLGASAVGTVVFGSKWTSNLEIWYEKLTGITKTKENFRMFIGTGTESFSSEMWEYHDGINDMSIIENKRMGTPVKKCINLNSTAFNSDVWWLSATPDRSIVPWGVYKNKDGYGSLEIKNTTGSTLKSYENKLPPENLMQVITQMLCCGYEYSELFYFIDNCRTESHIIEMKDVKKVVTVIKNHTKVFWDSLLLARPLYNEKIECIRTNNNRRVAELTHAIEALEPEPQNTAGYLNFLTDRYKERSSLSGILKGSSADYDIAKEHKALKVKIKKLEEKEMYLEIQLRNIIKECNILDFGAQGSITNHPSINNKRLFKNLVK